MAEKAENTRSTKAKAPRTNVPWVAAGYDDEATLVALRSAYPLAKWKEIREQFNRRVPEKRRRTLEAVYSKAKLICSAYLRRSALLFQWPIVQALQGLEVYSFFLSA